MIACSRSAIDLRQLLISCALIKMTLLQPDVAHATHGSVVSCASVAICQEYLNRALALDQEGRYEEALAAFRQAQRHAADPGLHINIGRTLHKLSRFSEALDAYRQTRATFRLAPVTSALCRKYEDEARRLLPPPVHVVVAPVREPPPAVSQHVTQSVSADASATASSVVTVNNYAPPPSPQGPPPPLYKRGWFWPVTLGVVLSAVGLTIGIVVGSHPNPCPPSSHCIPL